MDPRGLRTRLTGASCTACGAVIPVDRIVVLADRGDFAFVELQCRCGSRTMALVLAPHDGDPILDTAAHPELDPAAVARLATMPPIGEDDLLAMHRLLDGWTGDLRALVEPDGTGRTG
jgi:hypothetical protein